MSLWNLDLDRFNETDFLLEQYERREEWAKLHGDGVINPDTQPTTKLRPGESGSPLPGERRTGLNRGANGGRKTGDGCS